VFRLSEPEIATALEEVAAEHESIEITDAIGSRSLVTRQAPEDAAWAILDAYYERARDRVPSRDEWNQTHPALEVELTRRKQERVSPEMKTVQQDLLSKISERA
jgi:hypothetical protein